MSVYALILRHPRMSGLFAAALVARLPIGINGLAVVLFLREQTGSFSVPGAVAGGLALGTGLGAPFIGRAWSTASGRACSCRWRPRTPRGS